MQNRGFSEGVSEGVLTFGQPHDKNVAFKEFFEEAGYCFYSLQSVG
jgi:hypothetical protein